MPGAKRTCLLYLQNLKIPDNFLSSLPYHSAQSMNYDVTKYRKIDWKHFMMFHWIINPGIALNELLFGVRIPKVMLIEKQKGKLWVERTSVPCPHCNTIHDSKTWSSQNKTDTKNWFGLYCPACGGIIPCMMNATTFIVLAATSPIWYWFKKSWKENWLKKQPSRFTNLDLETPYMKNNMWWAHGITWGMLMFVFMSLFDLAEGREVMVDKIGRNFAVWIIFGSLFYGLMLRFVFSKFMPMNTKKN